MPAIVGVDTGGTFTDSIVVRGEGPPLTGKAPTTPDDPSEGVLDSLGSAVRDEDVDLRDVLSDTEVFFHGTTLLINTVLERTGSDVGVITTRGNRDALAIGRVKTRHEGLTHAELQNYVEQSKPRPIVPKRRIREIDERVDYAGEEIVPVNEDQVRDAVDDLRDDVDTIAVTLLWSFKNPSHERTVAAIVAEEAPDTPVYRSADVAPKLGEYERMATTVINAYTAPILENYLTRLDEKLRENGLDGPLYLMQSNGGVVPVGEAGRRAVGTIGSGPAGGVTGSRFIGRQVDAENLICTDVGGTSFDVGLVVDGELEMRPTTTVQKHTLYQPAVDVRSVGSGGGSVAWIDEAGALRVGPESAGSDPGPACYGWGGSRPTVTDADLLLGYLDPDRFLGGQLSLDVAAARTAMREHVAEPLDMSVEEAAEGVFEIANAAMSDLVRNVTVERGHDPRDFSIFAYGGAGPVHASFYGTEVGADSITVPLGDTASVFSAFGISTAKIRFVEERSEPAAAPFDADALMAVYEELEAAIAEKCRSAGIPPSSATLSREAELRYQEQVHQVTVPVPDGPLDASSTDEIADRFERRYEAIYGIGAPEGASIELVTERTFASVDTPDPSIEGAHPSGSEPLLSERDVYWPAHSSFVGTPVYDGTALSPGDEVDGPAVVHLPDTTVTVRPSQRACVDRFRNVTLGGA